DIIPERDELEERINRYKQQSAIVNESLSGAYATGGSKSRVTPAPYKELTHIIKHLYGNSAGDTKFSDDDYNQVKKLTLKNKEDEDVNIIRTNPYDLICFHNTLFDEYDNLKALKVSKTDLLGEEKEHYERYFTLRFKDGVIY